MAKQELSASGVPASLREWFQCINCDRAYYVNNLVRLSPSELPFRDFLSGA